VVRDAPRFVEGDAAVNRLSEFRKSCREIGRGKWRGAGIEDPRHPMQPRINLVKVFSATKARDREDIGDRVSAWIAANPGVEIVQTVVAQSSDRSFHCLSLVLICSRS
jgi:hypothetical protein